MIAFAHGEFRPAYVRGRTMRGAVASWRLAHATLGLCRDCTRPRGAGIRCSCCAAKHSKAVTEREKEQRAMAGEGRRNLVWGCL
jgi:hypothetical protein